VLAEGALDRLVYAAHHVTLEGKGFRPRQRPDAIGRSERTSHDHCAETESVRSPRTPATARMSITTLGAKAVQTKRND
jgi:hypothetical protein